MRGLIEAHTALPRTLLVEAYWWTPTTIFLAKSAQAPLAFPNPYYSLTPNLFPPATRATLSAAAWAGFCT